MIVVKNEMTSFYDCDDTLVMHRKLSDIPSGESVQVYDAVTKGFITLQINRPMVRLLRESHARGEYVVVWSRGGYRWASDVIKALDLVDCVAIVLSKPMAYFDDREISEWLPYRVYLKPDQVYKTLTKDTKK